MKWSIITLSIVLLLLTVLPFLPLYTGLIRIWSYPRLQIVVVMLIVLIGLGCYYKELDKFRVLIPLLVAAIVYQSVKFLPYTFLWKPEVVDTKTKLPGQEISIMCYNVYMENRKTAEFLELAEKQDADLILLAETDEFWCSSVKPLAAKYPYKVEVPLPNTYGLCLYSKLPLTQSEVKYLVEPDIPSIHTYVTLPSGQKIKLYCIHPEPPDLKKSTKDRDAELVIVAKEISTLNEPVIVAGDLNDVAWSSTTKLFGRLSKCNDPRVGRGLLNTFNARYLLFRWPLDHYFVSTHFTLNKIERLPFIGSDHFPIYISLTFDPTSQEENKQKEPSKRDLKKASEKLEDEKEGD